MWNNSIYRISFYPPYALEKSYAHLCALRDEVIAMGVLPPVSEWNKLNPYIK